MHNRLMPLVALELLQKLWVDVLEIQVSGVSYDRRMFLSKRYFSGSPPPVGKEEDIQC